MNDDRIRQQWRNRVIRREWVEPEDLEGSRLADWWAAARRWWDGLSEDAQMAWIFLALIALFALGAYDWFGVGAP